MKAINKLGEYLIDMLQLALFIPCIVLMFLIGINENSRKRADRFFEEHPTIFTLLFVFWNLGSWIILAYVWRAR